MRNLKQDKKSGEWKVAPSAKIADTIVEAIVLALAESRMVTFEFNGVTINVDGNSSPLLLLRDWARGMNGCGSKSVGPHPRPTLTSKELEAYTNTHARERFVQLLGLLGELAGTLPAGGTD